MPYYVETKRSARGKYTRVPAVYTRDTAFTFARQLEEMGSCGPIRVVSEDHSEVVKIS